MHEAITQSDRDFLAQLSQLGSATVSELCDQFSVTPNAVRQRLNRLLAAELITRTTIRQGRGRPQHKYELTDQAKRGLSNNYVELATVLWQQIQKIPDESIRQQIASDLKQSLVERYGIDVGGDTLQTRIKQLQAVLQQHGYEVEVDYDDQQLALKEHSCPYHDLAAGDSSICDLEQTVFEQILGVPLQLTQRCVDGYSCCRFEHVELQSSSTKN